MLAVLSEYVFLFDQWIVTEPKLPPRELAMVSKPDHDRDARLKALKTTLVYAVLEASENRIMGRQPCCDKVGLKRGPWTIEEDHKLTSFIMNNGIHC